MNNKALEPAILEVLKEGPMNSYTIRVRLREAGHPSQYLERPMRNLREKGLVYFKSTKWYLADVVPCKHCDGTGYVKNESFTTEAKEEEAAHGQD